MGRVDQRAVEPPEIQYDRLARFIDEHVPGGRRSEEGPVDAAIRVIEHLQSRVRTLEDDRVVEGKALRFRGTVKAATAVAKDVKDETEPELVVTFRVEATEDQIAAGEGIPLGEQAGPWAMKLLAEITKVGAMITVERRPVYAEQQSLAEAVAQSDEDA